MFVEGEEMLILSSLVAADGGSSSRPTSWRLPEAFSPTLRALRVQYQCIAYVDRDVVNNAYVPRVSFDCGIYSNFIEVLELQLRSSGARNGIVRETGRAALKVHIICGFVRASSC